MSGLGYIGENYVIDKLKAKGYFIYLPLTDRGIDFIANKENDFIKYQIKTSKFQKDKYFWFDININRLTLEKNVKYIFVAYCFNFSKEKFCFEVDSETIKSWIKKKIILPKNDSEKKKNIFSFFIYPKGDSEQMEWIYKNQSKEINFTKFLKNF